ncbi:START domain-containing protein [Vibrio sp. NH-UV-68]|uniref:START domain-containing protein n=1 Tax=unclassified Vibrio TaxID=2614977 RepID=UPI0036F41A71
MIKPILSLFVIFISFASQASSDQTDWHLARDKLGIEVYNRSIEGSDFKEFRSEADINASLTSIIALFLDTSVGTEWVENIDQMEEIEHFDPTHSITKTYSKAPWPVADREAIVENHISQDDKTLTVTIEQQGLPDYLPHPSDHKVVRIPYLKSRWVLTPIDSATTHLSYQVLTEPGGTLPAWLVNLVSVSQPYNTLLGMQKMLHADKYQNASLSFIQNY